jgi:hypothetical protein
MRARDIPFSLRCRHCGARAAVSRRSRRFDEVCERFLLDHVMCDPRSADLSAPDAPEVGL